MTSLYKIITGGSIDGLIEINLNLLNRISKKECLKGSHLWEKVDWSRRYPYCGSLDTTWRDIDFNDYGYPYKADNIRFFRREAYALSKYSAIFADLSAGALLTGQFHIDGLATYIVLKIFTNYLGSVK